MKAERWYILLSFSILVFSQCMTWITYGTVPATTRDYYGISVHQLDLLINWGCILYVVMAFPLMFVISSPRGLAYSVRLSAVLVLLSNILRCLPSLFFPPSRHQYNYNNNYYHHHQQNGSHNTSSTSLFSSEISSSSSNSYRSEEGEATSSAGVLAMLHIAQILNSCAGPISMSPCALLSHIWFEPRLRTTATTIAWVSSGLGITVSYIVCPYIAGDGGIPRLLYVEFAVALLAFVLIFAHFPQRPNDSPNSTLEYENSDNDNDNDNDETKPILPQTDEITSQPLQPRLTNEEHQFKTAQNNDSNNSNNGGYARKEGQSAQEIFWECTRGIRATFSSADSALAVVAGGVQLGIGSGWGSCLPQVLAGLDFTERAAGVLSFTCSILGSASSLAIGQVNDVRAMRRRHKALALGSFAVSLAFLGAFLLYVRLPGAPHSLLTPTHAAALVVLCGISVSTSCITPLFYEMLAETTYPVNQAISSGLVALLGNLFAVAYLVAAPYMDPGIYVLVFIASSLLCLVLTAFIHVRYKRQDSNSSSDS